MSFKALFDLEEALAKYTGAPYAVLTDGCTHALELCLRYENPKAVILPTHTYLSVVMLLHNLKIPYTFIEGHEQNKWAGEYQLECTNTWDSARRLRPDMYRPGQFHCLSFGWSKPMQLGRVGAILTDSWHAYQTFSRQRSDGRDLRVEPWWAENNYSTGFHYCPTLELCKKGLELLANYEPKEELGWENYPDCSKIKIVS
jgi:dTDP-4-amino-4,6-dideoxygalactose transaminase